MSADDLAGVPDFGEGSVADFDQVQASALELIRSRRAWFVYAVDDHLEGTYRVIAPELVDAGRLADVDVSRVPGDLQPRIMLLAMLRAVRVTVDELEARVRRELAGRGWTPLP